MGKAKEVEKTAAHMITLAKAADALEKPSDVNHKRVQAEAYLYDKDLVADLFQEAPAVVTTLKWSTSSWSNCLRDTATGGRRVGGKVCPGGSSIGGRDGGEGEAVLVGDAH